MTIKHVLGSLVLVAAIGACKGKGGGGADIDAFMKLDTEKAAAFDAGGKDCVAKAKSVGDWRKANTANYNVMRKKINDAWGKAGPPEDVQKKWGEQMKKNKASVMDAMLACSNDEAFGKMMDETKTE